MTIFAQTNGQRQLRAENLTTTGATLVVTSFEKSTITVESVTISAGAVASTISLSVTDGTTTWFLLNGVTISAHNAVVLDSQHIPLQPGWSIKAQAGTANTLSVLIVLFQSNQFQGSRN